MSKASEMILPLDELQINFKFFSSLSYYFYMSCPTVSCITQGVYHRVSQHRGFIAWKACVQWDIP